MSFITNFRPTTFNEIVGHEDIIEILHKKLIKKDHPRAYLFSGASGLGKTTLARIIGNVVNAKHVEFDAGNLTGVDSIRLLIEETKRKNIYGKPNTIFIIDEAHMLSKSAWNALLKTIEEPNSFTYFVFCTTELNKIPKTIQSRCLDFHLNPLSSREIYEILENTKIEIDKKYFNLISKNCNGSPREALVLLEKAIEVDDINRFKKLLNAGEFEEGDQNILNICRELVKSKPLQKEIIKNIKEYKGSYEGARIQIFNYLTTVTLSKSDYLIRLVCFEESIKSETTGKGELLIKILTSILEE